MTRPRAERSGVRIPLRSRVFSSDYTDHLWDPPYRLVSGYRRPFPGIKRLAREVKHALLSDIEVKNEWSCTFIPPLYLHDVDTENFTQLMADTAIVLYHDVRRRFSCTCVLGN